MTSTEGKQSSTCAATPCWIVFIGVGRLLAVQLQLTRFSRWLASGLQPMQCCSQATMKQLKVYKHLCTHSQQHQQARKQIATQHAQCVEEQKDCRMIHGLHQQCQHLAPHTKPTEFGNRRRSGYPKAAKPQITCLRQFAEPRRDSTCSWFTPGPVLTVDTFLRSTGTPSLPTTYLRSSSSVCAKEHVDSVA